MSGADGNKESSMEKTLDEMMNMNEDVGPAHHRNDGSEGQIGRRCPCCGRVTLHVVVPATVGGPIFESPGFAKKGLADMKLDLLALCGFGCAYCSSNGGNYLRTHQAEFAAETREQQGIDALPAEEPRLTFVYPDIIAKLKRQLATKVATWGGPLKRRFSSPNHTASSSTTAPPTIFTACSLGGCIPMTMRKTQPSVEMTASGR